MTATLPTPAPKLAPVCQPARTALALCCLACGESDVRLYLDLNGIHDEDDTEVIKCGTCEREYSLAEVRITVTGWTRLLCWIDSFPA